MISFLIQSRDTKTQKVSRVLIITIAHSQGLVKKYREGEG